MDIERANETHQWDRLSHKAQNSLSASDIHAAAREENKCKAVSSYTVVPRRRVSHSESSRMVCLSSFRLSSV